MALFNYECDEVKRIIEEVSPNYPQLTTYVKEWLYFYKYEYTPGTPVELEYETVSVNPTGSISNAIPFQYKSAILKGNTDENLQSVKMPVLKTTGENLFDVSKATNGYVNSSGAFKNNASNVRSDYIPIKPNTTYSFIAINSSQANSCFSWYTNDKTFISRHDKTKTNTSPSNASFLVVHNQYGDKDLDSFKGILTESDIIPVEYKPYKSNILTVNEDVTLRSNGSVYDELDLLTGKLTQRIDEDGSVLTQEVVKTVALTPLNKPYEGINHYELTSNIPCEAILEVPVVSTGEQTLEEINN